jgi:hypothetical protein
MRRLSATLPVFLLAALSAAYGEASGQSVRGRVLDAETRRPVAGVELQLVNARDIVVARALSSDEGLFHMPVRNPGPHRIVARHIAYADLRTGEIQVRSNEQVVLDLTISARAILLDPITITGRRADPRHDPSYEGLYARYALLPAIGSRRAVLWDDPEMASASNVAEVLSWFTVRRECTIVYWNGRIVDNLDMTNAWINEFSVRMLEGVEFYRRFDDAPASFRHIPTWMRDPTRIARCSVVAIWPLRPPAFRGEPLTRPGG